MSAELWTRAIGGGLALVLIMAGGSTAAWARSDAPVGSQGDAPAPTGEGVAPTDGGEGAAPVGEGIDSGAAEPDDEEDGLTTDHLVLDPEEANRANAAEAFRQGSDLYEMGKYPESIEQFQRAFELSREVQLLYNLGQAHWKWFDVDPDVDHLRQAAVFFRNYDKRMRLSPGYNPVEIDNILTAIDAQIENEERKIAEANRPVLVQPDGPTEEELRWEQRRRTTRALNISGTTTVIVGGVTLAAGLASVLTRVGYRLVLDNTTGTDGGVNLATAAEDARRRNGFLVSGQVAFGTLISAAVILPVGIALRVTGAVRDKKDQARARELDEQRERNANKAKVAIEPTLGGLRLRF